MRLSFEQWMMHDDWGNCAELLAPADAEKIEAGTWRRASGDVVCETCSKPYYDHERVLGALWLNRVCGDRLVKF